MGKRWLFALVAVGVMVGCCGVAATLLLRSSALKARMEQVVYHATGRHLVIAGKVRPLWSFSPGIAVTELSLANIPGGSRPEMVTVKRVEAHLGLLALLRGQVELTRVTLVQPAVLLERDAAGHPNWLFHPPETRPALKAEGPHRASPPPVMDLLTLSQGRITAPDLLPGRSATLAVPQLSLTIGAEAAQLSFQVLTGGGDLLGQVDASNGPAGTGDPLKATLTGAGMMVTAVGSYNPATGTIGGHIDAAANDPATLAPVLPFIPKSLRDLRIAATLPATALPGLTTSGALTQPVQVEVVGSLPSGPVHGSASVLPVGASWALRGMQLSAPIGDVAGDVALTTSPRPTVRGTLVSTRLNADGLRAMLATPPAPASLSAPPVAVVPPPGAKPTAQASLFSNAPLPWHLLRLGDADLQLSVATLHVGGADYRNAAGHLGLSDGALTLSPFAVVAPEGAIAFSATLDAKPEPPPAAVVLHSTGFSLDALVQAVGLPAGSSGVAELDVALHGAGDSPHALAASLTGHAGVALVNGAVANADLAVALGDVVKSAGLGLNPVGQSAVGCLALRLNAQSGQVSIAALKLDTSRLVLEGSGTIDLATEMLALQLRPLLRLGGAGVAAPLRVDGSLRRPVVAMESPSGEPGRSGIVIGGVSGAADNCAPELTAARDGRPGPMPTALASKSMKPADLLRSLFR